MTVPIRGRADFDSASAGPLRQHLPGVPRAGGLLAALCAALGGAFTGGVLGTTAGSIGIRVGAGVGASVALLGWFALRSPGAVRGPKTPPALRTKGRVRWRRLLRGLRHALGWLLLVVGAGAVVFTYMLVSDEGAGENSSVLAMASCVALLACSYLLLVARSPPAGALTARSQTLPGRRSS